MTILTERLELVFLTPARGAAGKEKEGAGGNIFAEIVVRFDNYRTFGSEKQNKRMNSYATYHPHHRFGGQ